MKIKKLALLLLLAGGLMACEDNSNENNEPKVPQGIETYMNISVSMPGGKTKTLPEDYNPDGTYIGHDWVETLDIYMQSVADGTIERKRFSTLDLTISGGVISPNQPFRTTSGKKNLYIVLNDPQDIRNTVNSETELIDIQELARIKTINNSNYDVIMMTGKSQVEIMANIGKDEVIGGLNRFPVDVIRVASKAIVTSTASQDVMDGTKKLGTITDLTYSVAQGTKQVYWLGQPEFVTYGTDYVTELGTYVGADYAEKYYDYSDLYTPESIPGKPAGSDEYKAMQGKFLYENTHKEGDIKSTEYRKGNTAYVLVRGIFTPEADQIVGGGTLVNGTFYVGQSDGLIYSSMSAAQAGSLNQRVKAYEGGKVLYYAWLNPDDLIKPLNSPVVRNNIYHINITGFSKIGNNWNPLFPEDPDTGTQNPDPKPINPYEPENTVDPVDPLTPEETYMSVDVTVIPWTVHSYDIEF